ncbi:unnamed protein product, partial [Effrenium voratum]
MPNVPNVPNAIAPNASPNAFSERMPLAPLRDPHSPSQPQPSARDSEWTAIREPNLKEVQVQMSQPQEKVPQWLPPQQLAHLSPRQLQQLRQVQTPRLVPQEPQGPQGQFAPHLHFEPLIARDAPSVPSEAELPGGHARARVSTLPFGKAEAAESERLQDKFLQVSNLKFQRVQAQAFQHWQHRWSALTQHRRQLRVFELECWHRSCNRAMTAWRIVQQREVTAQRLHKATGVRLSQFIFQVWKTQWQGEQKESFLLRLSDLFLRKRGLKCGVQALHRNVFCQSRLRKRRKVQQSVWQEQIRLLQA